MSQTNEFGSCPDMYRSLNTAELGELLQNDDKMEQIIGLDEKLQEVRAEREMLLVSNRSLAEDGLARRPGLCSGRFQLAQKYAQLAHLAAACWEKQRQLEALVGNRRLQTAQNLLQEQVVQAEEHSEELLQRFMEASLGLEDFLDSFQSSRRTYHIRRAKAEKILEVSEARQWPRTSKEEAGSPMPEEKKTQEQPQGSALPNGFLAQGPLRVFQVRYGLRPAILLPRSSLSPRSRCAAAQASSPPPVGLRLVGQVPGGWPASCPALRLQQLYRLSPQQTEPPVR